MKKKLDCVLLVEDNESYNFIHRRYVEKAGITDHIEIAENGKEALDFLKTKWTAQQKEKDFCRTMLIFLDINMPIMNGWEFLEEYMKLENIKKENITIIMLTTSTSSADMAKTLKILGSGCFLTKPLSLEMLDQVMQEHFPG
ncbi:MAG: response regulator [bacterium]